LLVTNFSLELAKPECSVAFNFQTRLMDTIAMPFCYGLMMALFGGVQLALGKTRGEVSQKLVQFASLGLSFLSIFFLKGIAQGFVCDEANFLRAEPQVVCDRSATCEEGKPCYSTIFALSVSGVVMYVIAFLTQTYHLRRDHKNEDRELDRYFFWTDSMEPDYYYWEMIIIVRKVLMMLMSVVFAEDVGLGWMAGVVVLLVSLCAHSYASPYIDSTVDFCEMVGLLGAAITYLSGLVFTLQHESCDPEIATSEESSDECLSVYLEYFTLFIILFTCFQAFFCMWRVHAEYAKVPKDDEGKKDLIKFDADNLKKEKETQDDKLDKRRRQVARQHTRVRLDAGEDIDIGTAKATFDNPVLDGDDDPASAAD